MKISKTKLKSILKSIINECINEIILTEGMDVSVDGFSYERKLNTLDGLCNHILDRIISPILNNIPEDQKQYFKKNSISFYDIFTPDGLYWQGPGRGTGIINFYISGFSMLTLQKIIKEIFGEFRKLNIKWGKISKEQSGTYKSQVIRIPILKNDISVNDGPPEIHLSNSNAYTIFHKILQYDGEHSFSMDAKELMERISTLLHDKEWVDKFARPKTTNKSNPESLEGDEWKDETDPSLDNSEENPHDKIIQQISKGFEGTFMGISSQDLWDRLNYIYKIAEWAISHGYHKIHVG